jgi:hypothetical protein
VGLNMNEVLEIECKKEYEALLKSGMAWEFYPWLTGIWKEDKEQFINEIGNKVRSIINDVHTEDKN